jgi:hypothetical protein
MVPILNEASPDAEPLSPPLEEQPARMDIAPRPAALAITLLRFITGFNDLPVRLDMRLSSQISSGFGYPTGHPSPCSAFAK